MELTHSAVWNQSAGKMHLRWCHTPLAIPYTRSVMPYQACGLNKNNGFRRSRYFLVEHRDLNPNRCNFHFLLLHCYLLPQNSREHSQWKVKSEEVISKNSRSLCSREFLVDPPENIVAYWRSANFIRIHSLRRLVIFVIRLQKPSFRRFLLPSHLGLEPRTDRLYSLWACRLRRRCYALCIASRCAHGAICARLACASTDSLALDYIASSSNRSWYSASLTARQQKRGNRKGYLFFVGGPSRTRT